MQRARAKLLADIRAYFLDAGVMEVDTPICSVHASTDPVLDSFSTDYIGPEAPEGRRLYLHTSPEFPMKRLLAADCGPIYQICKVFRNGELGRWHNPEFTLLEWYRPGFDHQQLMDEVACLINGLLPDALPVERISYKELFQRHLGFDPHSASSSELRAHAVRLGVTAAENLELQDGDGWLDLLMTHCLEAHLGQDCLCFIYDYPASQASLARIRPGEPAVAERFELYMNGIELANGFHELSCGSEQRMRFESDLKRRKADGVEPVPMDENLLAALESGIPDCSGVALGIDRLLMRLTGTTHIRDVLAFPMDRA